MSWVVNVRDLVGHPGVSREVRVAEHVAGVSTPVAEVPEHGAVAADLLLESVVEGILVSGRVSGRAVLRCARCLTTIERDLEVRVRELFTESPEEDDDEYPLGTGELDLDPMVRDALMLQLPFSPLCRPDCLGLCERCGGDRNLGECACVPEADPRWAALGALLERPGGETPRP